MDQQYKYYLFCSPPIIFFFRITKQQSLAVTDMTGNGLNKRIVVHLPFACLITLCSIFSRKDTLNRVNSLFMQKSLAHILQLPIYIYIYTCTGNEVYGIFKSVWDTDRNEGKFTTKLYLNLPACRV